MLNRLITESYRYFAEADEKSAEPEFDPSTNSYGHRINNTMDYISSMYLQPTHDANKKFAFNHPAAFIGATGAATGALIGAGIGSFGGAATGLGAAGLNAGLNAMGVDLGDSINLDNNIDYGDALSTGTSVGAGVGAGIGALGAGAIGATIGNDIEKRKEPFGYSKTI